MVNRLAPFRVALGRHGRIGLIEHPIDVIGRGLRKRGTVDFHFVFRGVDLAAEGFLDHAIYFHPPESNPSLGSAARGDALGCDPLV